MSLCFSNKHIEAKILSIKDTEFTMLKMVKVGIEHWVAEARAAVPNPFLLPYPEKDVTRNDRSWRKKVLSSESRRRTTSSVRQDSATSIFSSV